MELAYIRGLDPRSSEFESQASHHMRSGSSVTELLPCKQDVVGSNPTRSSTAKSGVTPTGNPKGVLTGIQHRGDAPDC